MAPPLRQLLTTANIDKKLAAILAGLGLVLLILAATVFSSLIMVQVSVTVLLASGVYLLLRMRRRASPVKKDSDGPRTAPAPPQPYPRFHRVLDIAFWVLLSASLITLWQGVYARPLSFLIVISVMSSIVAIQVFTNKNTAYCLTKVLIIGLLLRASAWYQFPSPVGSDSIMEVEYLRQLIATGHTGDFMGSYIYYPIAYIFTACASFTTGLGAKDSFFLLAVVEVISLVFLFLVGRQLFDKKIGLLAALLMAVFDWHVFWGFWLKAMTLGIALLPILIFLLLASRQKGKLFTFSVLSLLVLVIAILIHPFSTVAVVTVLILGWLSFLVCKNLQAKGEFKQPVTLIFVLLSLVAALGYWMYASGFWLYVGSTIAYALSFDAGGVAMYSLPRSTAVLTWQKLPVLVLTFLTILGCLSIFNIRKLEGKAISHVWLALVAIAMVILTFILFSMPELGAFEASRWYVFMGLIVAVPAAYGLLIIFSRRGWHSVVALFLSVLLLSGIMTTSHIASVDSVIPWDHGIRDAFTSSEIAAAQTVSRGLELSDSQLSSEGAMIYTDCYYAQVFCYEVHLPLYRVRDATRIYRGQLKEYQGILMLRRAVAEEVVQATFVGGHEQFVMDEAKYQAYIDSPQSILIYDNGAVKGLRQR